ncbi:jg3171 [Pararge aegeria aegeria]|uniref:Jg3171 protein n=1 Tax=Pararge aegeria aegeria TaxID=348720 RepID=A0A8S4QDW1_9NEOP|nr:jg3171 [Pararge aegeria aegeria]
MSNLRKKQTCKVHHVASEGDITKLDPENPLLYLSRRQKRPRNETQDKSEEVLGDQCLKEELLDLLTNWKKDQDVALSKLSLDITELKKQKSVIQASNTQLEQSLQFILQQYEDMKDKFLILERDRKEKLNYITTLESKLEEMQKRSRF